MKLLRLPALLLVRSIVRELRGIADGLKQQNALLERLAAHLAPDIPTATPDEIADTGLSYVDPIDQALILQYVARCENDTGRTPSDDEILSYLSDEKTRDLHLRMIERERETLRRDRELERLG
jgi:hypothetical protein